MSETRVVHVNDNVEGAVYIGRANNRKGRKASPFANPYKIGKFYEDRPATRGDALILFRARLIADSELLARLPELRDKPLACWCRKDGEPKTIDNVCHGDVLTDLLNRYTDDQLRNNPGAVQ